MRTTFEIVDILWQHIDNSSLKTAVSGIICKSRPINSKKEDIVINCLPIGNDQLQAAVANVNIYVPDIDLKQNGIQGKQPDFERLETLAKLGAGILTDRNGDDYSFDVQQQMIFEDEDSGCHYINFRIQFYLENL